MAGRLSDRFFALPRFHPLKLFLRVLILVLIGFVALCTLLYVRQGSLIYPAASLHFTASEVAAQLKGAGLVAWSPDGKGEARGYVLPDFADKASAPRGTIVFVHGNGEFAWQHGDDALMFKERGFRTLLYEFPGYAGRSGLPSERTLVPDLRAVVRALDKAGLGPVYLFGRSLGSGVAAAACADETLPVHGLVLATAWDTLPNVGAAHYPFVPVHWLMIDRYNSIASLANFKHPICMLRAGHDEIIPARLSANLYAHLPEPKKEIVFPDSNHNNWPGDMSDAWLDEALNFVAPK